MWEVHKQGVQVTPSPISSRATSIGSFCSVQPSQRSHSSMAAIRLYIWNHSLHYLQIIQYFSRCQSPGISPLISGSSWLGKGASLLSSHQHIHNASSTHPETTVTDLSEFRPPVICIEHVWTDYVSTSQ